ncbi:MAG: glutamate--cysteine ligase [Rhodobiaceae bacterium]|nr:glutamate--cysteine ligase [Rhodobiaceae bacterium]
MENNTESSEKNLTCQDLIAYFQYGCKSKSKWVIGTEHEKFAYYKDSRLPIQYDGQNGVKALLENLANRFDWLAIKENGNTIGLKDKFKSDRSVSIEPAGQIELSGAPLSNLHETSAELFSHLKEVKVIGEELGINFLNIGFPPSWKLNEMPKMPKKRYDIMREYMPSVGSMGLDMMHRTSTIQVNLDYDSEIDMVNKFRVGLALQPLVTALFSNSPFYENENSGYNSYRSKVWTNTDVERTGFLPFVFDKTMSFEKYMDYALDIPMYFLYREGVYLPVNKITFRDFMNYGFKMESNKLTYPTLDDWSNHLTTLFPEVRLKQFIEMRGADGGMPDKIIALSSFWVGLLYDSKSLKSAYDLISDWTFDEIVELRENVMLFGLNAKFRSKKIDKILLEILELSSKGLTARGIFNIKGESEERYLAPLFSIIDKKETSADYLIKMYNKDWSRNIDKVLFANTI